MVQSARSLKTKGLAMSFYEVWKLLNGVHPYAVRHELTWYLVGFANNNGCGTFHAKAAKTAVATLGGAVLSEVLCAPGTYRIRDDALTNILRSCLVNPKTGNLLYALPKDEESVRWWLQLLVSTVRDEKLQWHVILIFRKLRGLEKLIERRKALNAVVPKRVLLLKRSLDAARFLCAAGILKEVGGAFTLEERVGKVLGTARLRWKKPAIYW